MLLQHPRVAIRIGKASETRILCAFGVEPWCEASVPGSNRCLVSDLADFDPTLTKIAARGLEIRNDEIDAAN